MKSWIWMLMLAMCFVGEAAAQKKGVTLVCRSDDPFVFCTQGCKDEDKNWIPVDPISATWVAVPGYCLFPSPSPCCAGAVCLQAWTPTAITALAQYESICPEAKKQGKWTGQKRPENVPFAH
ncbi:hypothetical protein [Xanthomonas arboricola]|uniref:Uncharacterized protein n=1 Tax=Xanthomonas arboricola pv. populi TaxID=487823 RepID=A0A2S6Z2J8_9XANT|nr:hypothetical protein [Xanthomonas arboricola]PPT75140.1 hypothetical protein XaplCFBP3122_14635 [Xanthomonas arboricola pv. populi]PPU39097.1 hypothetical protein XaplCFBP3123_16010 [Xanthomonas arboricola pv. populi]RZA22736.1 MAG: hypothetical protein EOP02_15945 [Pseudomonadota bacterium]